MVTLLVAAFLIVHGLIHLGVYLTPKDPAARVPYDPAYSWALHALRVRPASMHIAAGVVASAVAFLYMAAGVAVLADLPAATGLALAGAGTALALKALWYNSWLSLGITLDICVIYAITNEWPASLF